jgi:hypothetical protein
LSEETAELANGLLLSNSSTTSISVDTVLEHICGTELTLGHLAVMGRSKLAVVGWPTLAEVSGSKLAEVSWSKLAEMGWSILPEVS